jgi:hypothetical protein
LPTPPIWPEPRTFQNCLTYFGWNLPPFAADRVGLEYRVDISVPFELGLPVRVFFRPSFADTVSEYFFEVCGFAVAAEFSHHLQTLFCYDIFDIGPESTGIVLNRCRHRPAFGRRSAVLAECAVSAEL